MTDHGLIAENNFNESCNCAQAVLLSFHEELGLDPQTALKLASSFGGGMGRLREVCGALSGLFMVVGMRYGPHDVEDDDAKSAHYEIIQSLASDFRQAYGSIICRDLLELDETVSEPVPEKRTADYYARRPCGEYVKFAARLMDQYERDGKFNENLKSGR